MDGIRTKIAFHTLGCKLNFSETATIGRTFDAEAFQTVSFSEAADIYVINSCSVTRNAEKRCKALVRQAMKKNPEACVAVVGCFSQINPEEISAIPGVRLVLGNADKFNLFEHIKRLADVQDQNQGPTLETQDPKGFIPSWSDEGRTRSFFKIQDGCDYFCSYCTIPLARGRSRSDTIAATLQAASKIARSDIRELVLSGVNIGDFGKAHNESLAGLLRELVGVDGLQRIRISSVEPDLLHDELIELVAAQPKLMPHFHIPLQSGSDQVLKAMGRRYDTGLFAQRVEKIRSLMPRACIAADLIVGFPGETDALFEQTCRFVCETDLSYIHVFTYSERDNTRALNMPGQVPVPQRQERSRIMHDLSDEKKKAFYLQNRHSTARVLWEKEDADGFMYGFTENYLRVKTPFDPMLDNQIREVRLNILGEDMVYLTGDDT
jgi:threonylcarbamoyladenosine tRNA methylthiotransferase MtaB